MYEWISAVLLVCSPIFLIVIAILSIVAIVLSLVTTPDIIGIVIGALGLLFIFLVCILVAYLLRKIHD